MRKSIHVGPARRVRMMACAECGAPLDATTKLVGGPLGDLEASGKPVEGDWTLCSKCGEILIFGKDLRPHRPTRQEMTDLISGNWQDWELLTDLQRKVRAKDNPALRSHA